jgi:hypothetical protein
MNRINSNHTRDKTDEMKIILDFADIDKLKASRLLSDKTELALAIAKKSLSQLPEIFPNGSYNCHSYHYLVLYIKWFFLQ